MTHRLALTVMTGAALLSAAPAFALSCLRPDLGRSFAAAAESESAYLVVHGAFDFKASAMPKADKSAGAGIAATGTTRVPAQFKGGGLTPDGFTVPVRLDVTLEVGCQGPWCGTLAAGEPQLAFLEQRDEGYVLSVEPCPGFAFASPTPEDLDFVTACYAKGSCPDP